MGIKSVLVFPVKAVKKAKEKVEENINSEKREKVEELKYAKADFVGDVSDVLMDWGIDKKDAEKIAEELFSKYQEKILEVL